MRAGVSTGQLMLSIGTPENEEEAIGVKMDMLVGWCNGRGRGRSGVASEIDGVI